MKRKYIIEAGVAAIVIINICIIVFPSFLKTQTYSIDAELNRFAPQMIQEIAKQNDGLNPIGKAKSEFSNQYYTGPTFNPQTNTITHRMFLRHQYIEYKLSEVLKAFPFEQPPHCPIGSVKVALRTSRTHKGTKFYPPNGGYQAYLFESKPYVIEAVFCVNPPEGRPFAMSSMSAVDDEGYLRVFGERNIPFNPTNGVSSVGVYYASSASIWPRKKAVIMDPPPPGEPDYTIK